MTEAHIKEATKMLGWFFDRCGKVPHYKGMMYVKNADNLKVLLDSVVGRIEKENSQQIEKIYNEENSYTVHFKNGSHFSFVVVDTVVVVGEHCHVLRHHTLKARTHADYVQFVDSKIRELELRSLAPVIDPCTMPEGNVMLNPKPLYLSMD